MPSSGVFVLGSFSRLTIALRPGDQRFKKLNLPLLLHPQTISVAAPKIAFEFQTQTKRRTRHFVQCNAYIDESTLQSVQNLSPPALAFNHFLQLLNGPWGSTQVGWWLGFILTPHHRPTTWRSAVQEVESSAAPPPPDNLCGCPKNSFRIPDANEAQNKSIIHDRDKHAKVARDDSDDEHVHIAAAAVGFHGHNVEQMVAAAAAPQSHWILATHNLPSNFDILDSRDPGIRESYLAAHAGPEPDRPISPTLSDLPFANTTPSQQQLKRRRQKEKKEQAAIARRRAEDDEFSM
ncbi:hypothetical protein FB45DRAFT_1011238 [Roridomyces roridus]|uniref:Uncharacterized protein n=1 Tax=Roridomyces roridus TaxID=1738132 RepID=A0AAD7B1E2_9AGAR|nr:hypothetical protein FB45DRAFT_1011238 [Roridomyces roridus]